MTKRSVMPLLRTVNFGLESSTRTKVANSWAQFTEDLGMVTWNDCELSWSWMAEKRAEGGWEEADQHCGPPEMFLWLEGWRCPVWRETLHRHAGRRSISLIFLEPGQ